MTGLCNYMYNETDDLPLTLNPPVNWPIPPNPYHLNISSSVLQHQHKTYTEPNYYFIK